MLYAAYTDKAPTIDGIIDDDEWALAQKTVCDDVSMLIDEPNWKGYRDLSVEFSAMYDEDYFYFRAAVTDPFGQHPAVQRRNMPADRVDFKGARLRLPCLPVGIEAVVDAAVEAALVA